MKKLASFVLAPIFVFAGLAGCAGPSNDAAAEPSVDFGHGEIRGQSRGYDFTLAPAGGDLSLDVGAGEAKIFGIGVHAAPRATDPNAFDLDFTGHHEALRNALLDRIGPQLSFAPDLLARTNGGVKLHAEGHPYLRVSRAQDGAVTAATLSFDVDVSEAAVRGAKAFSPAYPPKLRAFVEGMPGDAEFRARVTLTSANAGASPSGTESSVRPQNNCGPGQTSLQRCCNGVSQSCCGSVSSWKCDLPPGCTSGACMSGSCE